MGSLKEGMVPLEDIKMGMAKIRGEVELLLYSLGTIKNREAKELEVLGFSCSKN